MLAGDSSGMNDGERLTAADSPPTLSSLPLGKCRSLPKLHVWLRGRGSLLPGNLEAERGGKGVEQCRASTDPKALGLGGSSSVGAKSGGDREAGLRDRAQGGGGREVRLRAAAAR